MEKVRQWAATFWKKLRATSPILAFFLISFAIVVPLFGLFSAIVVSVFTTLFQFRYKRSNTPRDFLRFFLISQGLCLLAHLSATHLTACILLNLLVPFLLVFVQTSQFNPKGYFGYGMMFVFLEIMPPSPGEFPMEMAAMAFQAGLLVVGLLLYGRFAPKPPAQADVVQQALGAFTRCLLQMADGKADRALQRQMYEQEQSFHTLSYQNHKLMSVRTRRAQLYDMFAVLFQRASYLISDLSWQSGITPAEQEALRSLAALLTRVQQEVSEQDNTPLIAAARQLLDETALPDGRTRIFFRSFLHMLILILQQMSEQTPPQSAWRRINWHEFWRHIRHRASLESFEMRFALRCSIVLTISCTASYLISVTHSYWFPLNAFLLLQPDYEESKHRMKTRPIGTVLGCLLVFLAMPLLPNLATQLAFALVILCLMYCSTPGTWYQAVFSTGYALIMASMTIDSTVAMELRVVYLLLAVALVFVVNRFFFPTRRPMQYRFNLRMLLKLQRAYWNTIRQSLHEPVEVSEFSDLLTYFHMIYGKAAAYVDNPVREMDRDLARQLLLILWQLMSELEQVAFLIQAGEVRPEEYGQLEQIAQAARRQLVPDAELLSSLPAPDGFASQDLRYLLERYRKNLLRLSALWPA